jgi:hypothetical protein
MVIPFTPLKIVVLLVGALLAMFFYGRASLGEDSSLDGPRPAEQHHYFHNGAAWTPLVWGAPDGGMFNRPQYAPLSMHRYWFGAPYLQTMIMPPAGSHMARSLKLKENEFYFRYHVPPGYERAGWTHGIGYAAKQPGFSYGPNVYPTSRAYIAGTPQHPQYSGEATGAHINLLKFEGRSIAGNRDLDAAQRYLALGDEQFAKGEFAQALRHYRRAGEAAPDFSAAFFRQGFAYIASNRSDFAAAAFRRGLGLDPNWNESRFDLARLLGDSSDQFEQHAAQMRTKAETRSMNSDTYFTLGVLHFVNNDDQAATAYFDAVYHIGGKNAQFLQGFPAGSRGRANQPAAADGG